MSLNSCSIRLWAVRIREVEQAAFSPANIVSGIGFWHGGGQFRGVPLVFRSDVDVRFGTRISTTPWLRA